MWGIFDPIEKTLRSCKDMQILLQQPHDALGGFEVLAVLETGSRPSIFPSGEKGRGGLLREQVRGHGGCRDSTAIQP